MKDILLHHTAVHPSMTPQDVLKLCFQATFGAEHLLTDASRAHDYFMNEWESVLPSDTDLIEVLSSRYVRVHLGAWKYHELPAQWLFRIFYMTASKKSNATDSEFNSQLDLVEKLAEQECMPFSVACWKNAREQYAKSGGGAVHHSNAYRDTEHPAYRVVDRKFVQLIPLLSKLSSMAGKSSQSLTIAIDGRAASGKSTLAQWLAQILDAGIVHMDDFFLPSELRTPERLAQAGGNVHYERFAEQVLPHLKYSRAFHYDIFDCSQMQLNGIREIPDGQCRIVEGSYSHHPELHRYMDLRVFCTVSPEEQMRRILIRNGERMAKMFAERWIPMEERFFSTYHIQEQADITINTEA